MRPDADLSGVSGRRTRVVAVHNARGPVDQPQRLGVADRPRPAGRVGVGINEERVRRTMHRVVLEEFGHGERAIERGRVEGRAVPALGRGDVWMEDEGAGKHTGQVEWSGQPVDWSCCLTYLLECPPTSDDAS